jgi:hypothetical protein
MLLRGQGNKNCTRNRSGKDGQVESSLKFLFTNVRDQDNRVECQLMRQRAELAKKMGKDDFVAAEMIGRNGKRHNLQMGAWRGKICQFVGSRMLD